MWFQTHPVTTSWCASILVTPHTGRSPWTSAAETACSGIVPFRAWPERVLTSCCAAHSRCWLARRLDKQHAAKALASWSGPERVDRGVVWGVEPGEGSFLGWSESAVENHCKKTNSFEMVRENSFQAFPHIVILYATNSFVYFVLNKMLFTNAPMSIILYLSILSTFPSSVKNKSKGKSHGWESNPGHFNIFWGEKNFYVEETMLKLCFSTCPLIF